MDLVIHHSDENVSIELETGILVNGRLREADMIIKISKGNEMKQLPIEMKCYRTKSSSGGLRGAHDLFRYGIYEDLQLLESYANENYLLGTQLTMTDSKVFGFPDSKAGKSWDYDSAHGTVISNGIALNTPIGGKPASVRLKHDYNFNWLEINGFYFLKIKGT